MSLRRSKHAKTQSKQSNETVATKKQNAGVMSWIRFILGHEKPLLSKHGAESLILWSYTSNPDPSILAPILFPFWVKFAYLLPAWVSPNLVTVSGFATVLFMFILVGNICGGDTGWKIPNNESDEPPIWLFPFSGAVLFFYQTADAVDGRQGKRVGMYVHPSTELFDHGIDSMVTSLLGVTVATSMRMGHGPCAAIFAGGVWSLFYSTTWEHLNVGKIRFQSGLANPTEALSFIVVSFFLVYFYPLIWDVKIFSILTSWTPSFFQEILSSYSPSNTIEFLHLNKFIELQIKHVVSFGQICTGSMAILSSAMTIKKEPRNNLTKTIAFSSLVPMVLILSWLILMFCLNDNHTLIIHFKDHGRLLLVLCAATWNYATLMLIICEMSKQKYPWVEIVVGIIAQLYLLPTVVFYLPKSILNTMLNLHPNFNYIFLLYLCTAIALMRYAGLWLRYQHELCHYCGMKHWYTVQNWPVSEPNINRLEEPIEYLGKDGGHISNWGSEKKNKINRTQRIKALMKKEMVELL